MFVPVERSSAFCVRERGVGADGQPLVRSLHAASHREVAGDAPDDEEARRGRRASPTSSASTSSPCAAGGRPACRSRRGRRRHRCGTSSAPASSGRGRATTPAPCPSCGRPGRRDTASLRRRPSGGLRYPLRVDGSHAIGVDLGGTKILAGVVARDGTVVRRHERATPQDSQESVVRELEAAVVGAARRRDRGARLRRPVADRPGHGRRRRVREPAAPRLRAPRPHGASASACRRASTTTRTPPRSASGAPARAAASTTS